LGKVLVDFDYGIAAAKIARRSKATVEQVRHALDQSPLLTQFETGSMTNEQFAAKFAQLAIFGHDGRILRGVCRHFPRDQTDGRRPGRA